MKFLKRNPLILVLLGIILVLGPIFFFHTQSPLLFFFGILLIPIGLVLYVRIVGTITDLTVNENVTGARIAGLISFFEFLSVIGILIWPIALFEIGVSYPSPSEVIQELTLYAMPAILTALLITHFCQKKYPRIALGALVIPFLILTAVLIGLFSHLY